MAFKILKGFGVGEENEVGGKGKKLSYQSGKVYDSIDPAILKNVKEGVDYKVVDKKEEEAKKAQTISKGK